MLRFVPLRARHDFKQRRILERVRTDERLRAADAEDVRPRRVDVRRIRSHADEEDDVRFVETEHRNAVGGTVRLGGTLLAYNSEWWLRSARGLTLELTLEGDRWSPELNIGERGRALVLELLRGLRAKTKYNGKTGVVRGPLGANGRFPVAVNMTQGVETIALKVANLRAADE